MTIQQAEHAAGVRLEKGNYARNLLDDARNTQTGKLHIDPRRAVTALEEALTEAYALIVRLAGERDGERKRGDEYLADWGDALDRLALMQTREEAWQAGGEPAMVRSQRKRAEQAEAEAATLRRMLPRVLQACMKRDRDMRLMNAQDAEFGRWDELTPSEQEDWERAAECVLNLLRARAKEVPDEAR